MLSSRDTAWNTAVSLAFIMTKKIALVLVSIWWGWTVLIDFAVVPTVFRTINDFFNAGELGIALFSKLNIFEVIISSGLVVVSGLLLKQNKKKLPLILSCLCFAIVMFYFAYLTPKIIYLTDLWKEADAANQIGIAGIADIQQEHQFYHRIYVAVDTVKLLGLTVLGGLFAKA